MTRRLQTKSPGGRTVTFDWDYEDDPSDEELDEIIAEAEKSFPPPPQTPTPPPEKPFRQPSSFADFAPKPVAPPVPKIGADFSQPFSVMPFGDALKLPEPASDAAYVSPEFHAISPGRQRAEKAVRKEAAVAAGETVLEKQRTQPFRTPEELAEEDTGVERPQMIPGQNAVMDAYKVMTYPLQILVGGIKGKGIKESLGERYLATQEALKTADELEKLKARKDRGEALTPEESAKLDASPHFWETVGMVAKGVLNDPSAFLSEIGLAMVEDAPLMIGGVGATRGVLKAGQKAFSAGKTAARTAALAKRGEQALSAATKLPEAGQVSEVERITEAMKRLEQMHQRNLGVKSAREALVGPSKAKVIAGEAVENIGGNVAVGAPIEQQKGHEYGVEAGIRDAAIGALFMLPGMAKLRAGKSISSKEFDEIARVVNRSNLHKHPQIQELLPVFKEISQNTKWEGYFKEVSPEREFLTHEKAKEAYKPGFAEKAGLGEGAEVGGFTHPRTGKITLKGGAEAYTAVEEAAHSAEIKLKDPALKAELDDWRAGIKQAAIDAGYKEADLPPDNEIFAQAFTAQSGFSSKYPEIVNQMRMPDELFGKMQSLIGVAKRGDLQTGEGLKVPANEILQHVPPGESQGRLPVLPKMPQPLHAAVEKGPQAFGRAEEKGAQQSPSERIRQEGENTEGGLLPSVSREGVHRGAPLELQQTPGRGVALPRVPQEPPQVGKEGAGSPRLEVASGEARARPGFIDDIIRSNAEARAVRHGQPVSDAFLRDAEDHYFDPFEFTGERKPLPNRAAFVDAANSGKYGNSFAKLDIADFKRYNDEYGHANGDKVLDAFGQIYAEETSASKSGFAANPSGDEFNGIQPDDAVNEAVLKRVSERFNKSEIEFFDETGKSAGVEKNFRVDYGIGRTPNEADARLVTNKAARKQREGAYRPAEGEQRVAARRTDDLRGDRALGEAGRGEGDLASAGAEAGRTDVPQARVEPSGKEPAPAYSLKPASEAGVPDRGGKNPKEIERARKAWEKQGTDSPYFKRWFAGASEKVKKPNGEPLVLFHGTGNKSGILSDGFSHKFTDKGNDQFGSGFYFTNKEQTASGYTRSRISSDVPKIGGEGSPGVIDAYLAIKNPIITNTENPRPKLNMSFGQAKAMIRNAPEIRDPDGPLSNWGDVREEGWIKVLNDAVENYTGDQIFALANDFYAGEPEKFLRNLKWVTGGFIGKKHGLDGWVHEFPTGEKHYVAWFPEQIKSATGNRGTFDPESPNILYSLKPMVEQKVQALRKSEEGYGQAYSNLIRDKEETWASLEDDARKIAESWDWDDFTKTTKGRQLTAPEVMAIGARIKDADVREVDALTDAAAARAAGDKKGADLADAKAAGIQLEKVALLQAGLNNATQSARALAVHAKWMDAIGKNADTVFLLKAIRELGVKDEEALKLLRIFKEDPKNFGAAIHTYLKFGAVDKLMEYWKAGLLSGAPTHVANTVGNTVEAGLMNAESFVSGGMDKILGLFQNNGERQRYMGEGLRETVGLAKGFFPAAQKFLSGLAPIAKLESKNVNLENKFERQVGAIKGKKGELIRTPFKLLELEDDYFKTLGRYADIQKLAYRKARKEGLSGTKLKAREGEIVAEFWNAPDKHRDMAQEIAKSGKVRTYQEAASDKPYKNSFASLADEIAKAKNSQAPAVRLMSNIIFPFSKTPANIFDRAIERSPIGYIHSAKVLNDWGKAAKAYETKVKIAEQNPGNAGHQQAAKSALAEMNRLRGAAADQLARATVGTVGLTGIGLLASQGIITGSGPSDPDKRKLLENELGWAPYSVKIGDKYLPLQRIMGAMGPSIGTIADIFEAAQAGDEKGASKSLEASLKNITDQSYLQGLMEFASAVQDPKRYAKTYAMNLGTSMLPFSSLTRSVARATDKTQRDVKGEGFIDEFSKRLQANIPFLSRKLPEKYGATGNVQERKGTAAERLLSPAPVSKENAKAVVEKALLGLSYKPPKLERTLKTNLSPDKPAEEYRLTDEEFDVLLKARREAAEELKAEIEGQGWKEMDVDEQSQTAEEVFQRILQGAREEVKDMIRARLGE